VLLLLFDIDGTLLQRASVEHAAALRVAAGRVHGVDLLGVDGVEYAGRTDRAITRDLLAAVGVSAIDDAWMEQAAEEYAARCPADLSATVAPGMVELLSALAERPDEFRLSLVTGNLEPVARRKLMAAGIGHFFADGQGGFGSDHEDRGQLPAIARARASSPPWERGRTVVIGDTPRDIHCARVDEVRVVAVATGPYPIEALAEADAVVDDARSLLPVLEDWAGGRP
jgi:phosphoglycolate phosphatase